MMNGEPIAALAGTGEPDEASHAQRAAVIALDPLHSATAKTVEVDDRVLEALVRRPLSVIGQWRRTLQPQLDDIAAVLEQRLRGRRLTVGEIHGDYAPGNVMWDSEARAVCGLIDWELSTGDLPPELDTVLFCLASLLERRGIEWGALIDSLLDRDHLPSDADLLLETLQAGPNGLDLATAVILTWMHHAASNLDKSTGYRSNSLWLTQNVDRVVATIHAQSLAAGRA
jgi:aminoglycoside phosphotransferase (APT) family kinase protein